MEADIRHNFFKKQNNIFRSWSALDERTKFCAFYYVFPVYYFILFLVFGVAQLFGSLSMQLRHGKSK